MFAGIKKLFQKKKIGPHYTVSELNFFHEKFLLQKERYRMMAAEIGTDVTDEEVAILHAVDASMHFSIGSFEAHSIGELHLLNKDQIIKKLKLDKEKVAEVAAYFKT